MDGEVDGPSDSACRDWPSCGWCGGRRRKLTKLCRVREGEPVEYVFLGGQRLDSGSSLMIGFVASAPLHQHSQMSVTISITKGIAKEMRMEKWGKMRLAGGYQHYTTQLVSYVSAMILSYNGHKHCSSSLILLETFFKTLDGQASLSIGAGSHEFHLNLPHPVLFLPLQIHKIASSAVTICLASGVFDEVEREPTNGNRNLTLSSKNHILDRFPSRTPAAACQLQSAAARTQPQLAIRQAIEMPVYIPIPWATGNRKQQRARPLATSM
nr:hypothetical protein Iba_chr04dCG10780 [Ipomoea batatas]